MVLILEHRNNNIDFSQLRRPEPPRSIDRALRHMQWSGICTPAYKSTALERDPLQAEQAFFDWQVI